MIEVAERGRDGDLAQIDLAQIDGCLWERLIVLRSTATGRRALDVWGMLCGCAGQGEASPSRPVAAVGGKRAFSGRPYRVRCLCRDILVPPTHAVGPSCSLCGDCAEHGQFTYLLTCYYGGRAWFDVRGVFRIERWLIHRSRMVMVAQIHPR